MVFDSSYRSNKMLIHRHLADAQRGSYLTILQFLGEAQLEHATLSLGQSRPYESLQTVEPLLSSSSVAVGWSSLQMKSLLI